MSKAGVQSVLLAGRHHGRRLRARVFVACSRRRSRPWWGWPTRCCRSRAPAACGSTCSQPRTRCLLESGLCRPSRGMPDEGAGM